MIKEFWLEVPVMFWMWKHLGLFPVFDISSHWLLSHTCWYFLPLTAGECLLEGSLPGQHHPESSSLSLSQSSQQLAFFTLPASPHCYYLQLTSITVYYMPSYHTLQLHRYASCHESPCYYSSSCSLGRGTFVATDYNYYTEKCLPHKRPCYK